MLVKACTNTTQAQDRQKSQHGKKVGLEITPLPIFYLQMIAARIGKVRFEKWCGP